MDVPLTITSIMRYGTSVFGDREVVTWTGDGTRRRTYAEAGRRAARLANALRRLGIDADQRVGTFMWNNAEHLEAYLAVPSMGAVLHTLNIRLGTAEVGLRAGPLAADARQDRPALPPAATPVPAAARTAATSPARPATSRPTPASASPCALTATTTNPRCCSTPTRPTCGAGSPPTCPAAWPGWPGLTQKWLHDLLRIRFVKVAEYQARGIVHFHAVIRLDAPGEDYQPPPATYTADLLCDAIDLAAAAVSLAIDHDGLVVMLGFGAQTDTRIIRRGTTCPAPARRSTAWPSRTTSPSTPPRPSPPPACPPTGYALRPTSNACAAPCTTGG